jgi:hypothetical protein
VSRCSRWASIVVLCLLAWPGPASAQDEAFKQGMDARGDRKWQDVVRSMRLAIQRDGQESSRRVGGGFLGRGTEYLPHYFLGEALMNMQDCAGAVEAWSASEQQGVVRSNGEFIANIRKGYQACASKGVLPPGEYAPLLSSTGQAYRDANLLAQRITGLGETNRDAWRPDLNEQFERARAELQTAYARLTSATRTRSASEFAESKTAADRALTLLRPLEARLTAAIDNLSLVQRRASEVEQLIGGADAADRAVESAKYPLTPQLAAARTNGRAQLAQARDRLAAGRQAQNPAMLSEALKYVQSASAALNDVLGQTRKLQLAGAAKAAEDAFTFIDASFATLDRLTADKPALVQPQLAGEREALQKQVDTLRRRFERARRTADVAAVVETARLAADAQVGLDALLTSFGPITLRDRGVHAALEEGARQFFAGEYQKLLTTLDPNAGLSGIPLQLHVHLFRAAALHALYVRSGETDPSLRTRALAEIEQCRRIHAAFQPDARAFGPRFLAFYRSTP